ncbi:DUF554 domain-containing protein [soil metagenome]
MFIGIGTITNIGTIVVGSALGLLIGHRLRESTRSLVTDALGLVTLLIAAQAAMAVSDSQLTDEVPRGGAILIVLGALAFGGIIGSALGIEARLESLGGWLQGTFARPTPAGTQPPTHTFVEGFVTSSLVFCVGPLTILGSLNEGLGQGADQLILKSVLDGFAALAFAASLGIGVMASALSVGVIQGTLTVLGVVLGSFVPDAHIVAMTATGGLILVGVAFKLLQLRTIAVGNLLPALILAPVLTQVAVMIGP